MIYILISLQVLGESYQEFSDQRKQEAAALALTLGKGKRVRRQVNYAEQQALLELEARVSTTKSYIQDDSISDTRSISTWNHIR